MLVFSRRLGERFFIGEGEDQVKVMIVRIDGGNVRLGIEAPRRILIDREEIARARARDKAIAAKQQQQQRSHRV